MRIKQQGESNMNTAAIDASNTLGANPATGVSTTKNVNSDTFLKLLVEQLKHQDPLAPQDGTQFVAQLAQFSSLDQLVSMNQELGQLIKQQQLAPPTTTA